MTSAQHPNRIYFSSLDRSPVDSNTDFTISFDTPIENAKNFEVVTASFPNTFHQFAPYETILYFYHELFFGGTTAIGIPMSITLFQEGGATGENSVPASRPAGRQEYIDGRYFLDGEDLQDYLNDWIQSLSVSWPTQASGLRPFYHPNDDPTQPITYVTSEASSGITFSALSFDYDTTTSAGGRGSLKYTFTDSGGSDVRIASIINYGILRNDWNYPSQLGYKLGYTDLIDEAFGDVVSVDSSNNKFTLSLLYGSTDYVVDNSNNLFSIMYAEASAPKSDHVFTIPSGRYPNLDSFISALNQSVGTTNLTLTFTKFSTNQITLTIKINGAFTSGTDVNGNFLYNGATSTLGSMVGISNPNQLFGLTESITSTPYTGSGTFPNGSQYVNGEEYVLDTADYTADALALEIQQCVRTQNVTSQIYAYLGTSFLCTASANKLTFNFASATTGVPIQLIFNAGDSVENACRTNLGFVANVTATSTGSSITAPNVVVFQAPITPASHVASDPINLIRTSTIYFASSLSGGEALSSAGRKDILFAVPLTAPVGSVQLYQSTLSGVVVNRPPDVLRNLRVTLLDDNFQTMEAMPQNSSISVEVHFAYQDENQTNNVSTIRTY